MVGFAVIGGDLRNVHLARLLEADGHRVNRYGFDALDKEAGLQSKNLYEAIENTDVIICPIPCVKSAGEINAVYSRKAILADDVLRLVKPWQIFMAGLINDAVDTIATKYNVTYIDLLKREELAVLNAVPTAEGAIQLAMEHTDFTLHSSEVMVIGYGRIGRVLCKTLSGIGAHVHPVECDESVIATCKSFGYKPIHCSEMNKYLHKMQIIINTVPKTVIDKNNLKNIGKECLLIDLASAPHGINCADAKAAGINVLYAGSLPGTIAPRSAAMYIRDTIYRILSERSVINT